MQVRTITLNTTTGPRAATIEPLDNNGRMQYVVTVDETLDRPYEPGWYAVIENESGRYRQSPESVEQGPQLSLDLLTQISETIQQYFA